MSLIISIAALVISLITFAFIIKIYKDDKLEKEFFSNVGTEISVIYTNDEQPMADPNNRDSNRHGCSPEVIAITEDEKLHIVFYNHFEQKWFTVKMADVVEFNDDFKWIYKPKYFDYD